MSIKIRIPTPLQKLTSNKQEIQIDKTDQVHDIRQLIDAMEKDFPGFKERLCDETGKIRRFINIYVNEEDIRFLQLDKTAVKDGDSVSIIPAIAGGGLGGLRDVITR